MNYYRAKEQDTPPYIVFELVATSTEELERLELTEDPLVVPEPRLTDPDDPEYISYEFGVCHLRVQNGELVPVEVEDINEAESNLGKATQAVVTKTAGSVLEKATLLFDGHHFPLNAEARQLYQVIFNYRPANYELSTLDGNYILNIEQIDAFEESFAQKVLQVFNLSEG